MSLGKMARKIWHDLFYAAGGKAADRLALTCAEATSRTDHSQLKGFRYWLHLSVCQACKNYYDFSRFLQKNISKSIEVSKQELTKLNNRLIAHFSKPTADKS